ncbi:MAG: bifunctional metallophosphatase/5'-nucleotidase [Sphingobacteriia bacterium]|nr:MAG: bifunctional metallophosphatase/5'-nucleotidase [Sphingobacteriia bacterium]TAG31580.1 MAG: bifunctional metallophosphatase/5'-nucleotidase [Sphingobacteriia bacterium]
MNRRKFIRETAFTGGALLASGAIGASIPIQHALTILHTNDVHSRIDPFPMDGSRNQGLGGVVARAAIIQDIRANIEQVLLLDAGDIFQGTPYFNLFRGAVEIKAMSKMGYDAMTIGNHDFDAGIENFANQLQHANFPVVICNYDFTGTAMETKYQPYIILEKGKLRVGILGVGIALDGIVAPEMYGRTQYQNPITAANATAAILKEKKCDMIICLSHLGDKYENEEAEKVSDEILAKESYNIDLIIGGHTHRFFEQPRKYRNKSGGDVLVNQMGWGGIQMGRMEYIFSGKTGEKRSKAHTVVVTRKTSE